MNCRKVSHLLSAYMDGELAGVEQLQIQRHLRDCAECYAEYESLLFTKRLLSGLAVQEPRPDMEQRILNRIARDEESAPTRFSWHAWWTLLSYPQRLRLSAMCAALSVAALFLSVTTYKPASSRQMIADAPLTPVVTAPYPPASAFAERSDVRMSEYLAAHRAWEGAQPTSSGPAITPAGAYVTLGAETRAGTDALRP